MRFAEKMTGDSASKNEASAWDMLTQLNEENPDDSRFADQGAITHKSREQKQFEADEKQFREIGEKAFPKLTDAAKEKYGVRDGHDLGEMMHEQRSWEKQINEEATAIDKDIAYIDGEMRNAAHMIGQVDVLSGEPTADTVISFPTKEKNPFSHDLMVLGDLNMICNTIPSNNRTTEALIMLATDMNPEPVDDPNGRTDEALEFQGQTAWLAECRGNKDYKEEIEKSPLYFHVKRLVELRKQKKEGSLKIDDPNFDPTDNRLFRHIDEYLSKREEADKAEEENSSDQ